MTAWTSPATWVAGAVLTAAQLNTQLRDNMLALGEAWTSWTPTFTASVGSPSIGNGSISGGYRQAGKDINYWLELSCGSTTSFGTGTFQFTLPVGESAHRWGFNGIAFDNSASASYPVRAERTTAALLSVRCDATTAGNAYRNVTSLIPFTWANNDTLTIHGTYEAS